MVRKIIPAFVVAAMVGSMSHTAWASPRPGQTITSAASVTANVSASCTVTSNGALNFAEYKPAGVPLNSTSADIARSFDPGSADAMMQCTANTPYSVTVGPTTRHMVGSAHGGLLEYTYNVLGTFTLHRSGSNVTCPIPTAPNTASGTTDAAADAVNIEFEGCINPGKWPTPDTYTDTFAFTVSF
jgi:spore coat protein U-like protein